MHDVVKTAFEPLFNRAQTPEDDELLGVGKALHDVHVPYLTAKDLLGSHYEAILTMNLIHTAVRFHHPLLLGERSRLNDSGYIRQKLAEIEQTGRWPIVRGELVKFFKLVSQELKARTPDPERMVPLTRTEEKVLGLILQQPPGGGITGRQIINQLCREGFLIDQSTLTSHIIPKLKLHRGVRNRGGVGYFVASA